MDYRIMLTNNDSDAFYRGVHEAFPRPVRFLRRIGDEEPVLMTWHYNSEEVPAGSRIISKPRGGVGDSIILGRAEPPPEAEEKMRTLVMVNLPVPFSEVAAFYDNSVVGGYSRSEREMERLRDACGVRDAFFFASDADRQRGAMRYVYGWDCPTYILGSGFRGLLKESDIDPVIAEGIRKTMLDDPKFSPCPGCTTARIYYDVQQSMLGDGRTMRDVFGVGVLAGRGLGESEYPVMKPPGRCGRWHPTTQSGMGRGNDYCGGKDSLEASRMAYSGFVSALKAKLGK